MQDRYAGDIGDWGKLGLLRSLADCGISLGVNWYLVPDENHNDDGKHVAYLQQNKYLGYDDVLFLALKNIVSSDCRSVQSLETAARLPPSTAYYHRALSYPSESGRAERCAIRQDWHDQAALTLAESELIFLDPDNGLETKSVSPTAIKGPKYVAMSELEDYVRIGKSIIFYNHRSRKTEEEYLERFRELIKKETFENTTWIAMKYVKGTIRDYFFVLQKQHVESISIACEKFLESKWQTDFAWLNL